MEEYDPIRFVNSLSAKLATRSRHVCLFLGAGVGKACGLPDVKDLEKKVLSKLNEDDKKDFLCLLRGRNIEKVLTRLRRISTLVSGSETVDSLTEERAKKLDKNICKAIIEALSIEEADLEPAQYLASWVARSNYRLPIELFTVNYDLLLETALDKLSVPYFDGFVGNIYAGFRADLVEGVPGIDDESIPSLFARLWKLHGSVNWVNDEKKGVRRIGHPASRDEDGTATAIYPSDTKYKESRRVPFVVLQDRLRRALNQAETLVLISGYSFEDYHLNELIFDAASRRERSEFVAFCYDEIPSQLEKRALRTPNLQVVSGEEAVLSGLKGIWKDVPEDKPHIWRNEKFALRDFKYLANYLSKIVTKEPTSMNLVEESEILAKTPNTTEITDDE